MCMFIQKSSWWRGLKGWQQGYANCWKFEMSNVQNQQEYKEYLTDEVRETLGLLWYLIREGKFLITVERDEEVHS